MAVLVAALAFLVAALAVPQEVRRPTGRVAATLETSTPTPTATPTPTVTPTPDPCADCPDPESFTCQMWPAICFQCWEDCGQPIATHTPTPQPTPTKTPTLPPTPTPQGPACELSVPGGGAVYLVAFCLHESSVPGTRYSFQTAPLSVPPGAVVRPCPCQGHPVGFKWYTGTGTLLKACGDTSTKHWHIFSDGFETGDTSLWR